MFMGLDTNNDAKEQIRNFKLKLGLPGEDDWHYVWVNPIKVDGKDNYTVEPMIEWCRENRFFYWEYKWINEPSYKKWRFPNKLATLYPDRRVCFRFSEPEHASLFKLTWS